MRTKDVSITLPEEKKVDIKFRRQKKSSVKNFFTDKIIRHFLQTIFITWLSENIN